MEEAEEGHCGILMVACCGGSRREMDGGSAIAMDDGGAIGQRRMGGGVMDTIDAQRRRRRQQDGVTMSGRGDTTINKMHGQKLDGQKETGRRTLVARDDGRGSILRPTMMMLHNVVQVWESFWLSYGMCDTDGRFHHCFASRAKYFDKGPT